MVGQCHRSYQYDFDPTPGGSERQEGLACSGSWGHEESDTTKRQQFGFYYHLLRFCYYCIRICVITIVSEEGHSFERYSVLNKDCKMYFFPSFVFLKMAILVQQKVEMRFL